VLQRPGLRGFTLKQAFRTSTFWYLFFIWIFHGAAVYLIMTHLVPHAIDSGISIMIAATIVSVLSGFTVLGGLSAGGLSDKIGRKLVGILGALMGAIALLWLMWMPNNLAAFYIFAAFFGFSWGAISTMISAMVGDLFGMRNIGSILGWIGMAWFIGAAIGPSIGGSIYDANKSYFWAFLFGAIAMLIVAILMWRLSSPGPIPDLAEQKPEK
jgi:MFS family permease